MKKALSLLMVFCLLAALLPAMSAAAATNPVAVITVSGIDHPQPDGEQDLTPEITLDHPDALESVQITWFDMTDENDFVGTQMAEGETFTLGHHVYARIRVTLKPGCDFSKSDSSYYTGTVNFDGLLQKESIRVETDSENRAYLNLLSKNYYVRDAMTTQGVGVVFKHDFDRLFGKKKQPQQPAPIDTVAPKAAALTDDTLLIITPRKPESIISLYLIVYKSR